MTALCTVLLSSCDNNLSVDLFFCLTETSGPAFDEFLELIGKRIALKGFEGYRAQLDNRSKVANCTVSTFIETFS